MMRGFKSKLGVETLEAVGVVVSVEQQDEDAITIKLAMPPSPNNVQSFVELCVRSFEDVPEEALQNELGYMAIALAAASHKHPAPLEPAGYPAPLVAGIDMQEELLATLNELAQFGNLKQILHQVREANKIVDLSESLEQPKPMEVEVRLVADYQEVREGVADQLLTWLEGLGIGPKCRGFEPSTQQAAEQAAKIMGMDERRSMPVILASVNQLRQELLGTEQELELAGDAMRALQALEEVATKVMALEEVKRLRKLQGEELRPDVQRIVDGGLTHLNSTRLLNLLLEAAAVPIAPPNTLEG